MRVVLLKEHLRVEEFTSGVETWRVVNISSAGTVGQQGQECSRKGSFCHLI